MVRHPDGPLAQTFLYDAYSRCTGQTLGSATKPDTLVNKTKYTPFNAIGEETNFLGNVTRFTRNERMLISTITSRAGTPDEIIRKIHYNQLGKPIEYVDGRGFITMVEYDGFGRPRLIRDRDNNELVVEYDAVGRAILQRLHGLDPHTGTKIRWSEVEFHYDAVGRLISRIDHLFTPGVQVANEDSLIQKQYFYDSLNRIESIVDSGETLWEYEYDGLDRLRLCRDADGNETEWHYDDVARTITVIERDVGVDESSNPVTQIFQHVIHLDARGLPIEEIDGLGNSVHKGFDSRRLLTYFADANQHEFFRDYDLFRTTSSLKDTNSRQSITIKAIL